MTTFTIHTPDSAPSESKAQLESVQQRYGQIPNLFGVLAEAPIAVEAYDTLGSLAMRSSFSPTERHVVWFTINAYHDCHYCMPAHTFLAQRRECTGGRDRDCARRPLLRRSEAGGIAGPHAEFGRKPRLGLAAKPRCIPCRRVYQAERARDRCDHRPQGPLELHQSHR